MHEPQGPLPREVYVRRRAAAGIAAVVVVLLVIGALYLASRGEGTDTASGEDDPTTGQNDSTGPAEPEGDEATPTTTTTGAEDDDEEDPEGEASRGRCDDQDLDLQVWPAEPNFAAGDEMRFFMQVENRGDATCDTDLVEAPLAFEVYELDTNAKVWSSVDCTRPEGEDDVDLHPGQPVPRQIDWSGRVSAPGECSADDRPEAPAGYYQVYALVGDVFSPAATFNIVEPGDPQGAPEN